MIKKSPDQISQNVEVMSLGQIKEEVFRKFRFVFYSISLVPFSLFLYFLFARPKALATFGSEAGLLFFALMGISICGCFIVHQLLRDLLGQVNSYAQRVEKFSEESNLIASVSHELRNPLSALSAGLSNISDGLAGRTTKAQKKIVDLCQSIIKRMSLLISDLLDLHKIEIGILGAKRKLCNFVEILEKQMSEFEYLAEKKGITLVKEIHSEVLSIWADELKIEQVINNLLGNAIKYTPSGGSTKLKVYPFSGSIRFECFDNAPLIPPEKLEKVFDRFHRLDQNKEGTGLGLAITKDIVEFHQGKIWAENHEDCGNKFVVLLPQDLRTDGPTRMKGSPELIDA